MTDKELDKLDNQMEEILVNLFIKGKDNCRIVLQNFNPRLAQDQGLATLLLAFKGMMTGWGIFVDMPLYKYIFYKIKYRHIFKNFKRMSKVAADAFDCHQFEDKMCALLKNPQIFIEIRDNYGRRFDTTNG